MEGTLHDVIVLQQMTRLGVRVRSTEALKTLVSCFFTDDEGKIWYGGRVIGDRTYAYPVLEDGGVAVKKRNLRFAEESKVKLIDPLDVGISSLRFVEI